MFIAGGSPASHKKTVKPTRNKSNILLLLPDSHELNVYYQYCNIIKLIKRLIIQDNNHKQESRQSIRAKLN